MDPHKLSKILTDVKSGKLDPDKALNKLKHLPYEDLGYAKIDHHRKLRTGIPEVIYAPGKTARQITELAKKMKKSGVEVLITRTDERVFKIIKAQFHSATFNRDAGIIKIASRQRKAKPIGTLAVISAGTSDIPVAEEAALTAEAAGAAVIRIYDVGVAGIHRLFAHQESIARADIIIVVAGMEGALASVVAGLVDVPLIAVPTSVGYGASFNGLAALLAMLNSCVPGVVVVNIDNGFGAACAATLMLQNKKTGSKS